jgi:hypothetical protein
MNKFFDFKSWVLVLAILFLLLLFQGCANLGGSGTSADQFGGGFQNMTPKQKVVWMLGVYNSQYDDYMRVTGYISDGTGNWQKVSSPDLSDNTKSILEKKKKLLLSVYPLISLYNSSVVSGKPVDQDTERKIFTILDSIASLVPI